MFGSCAHQSWIPATCRTAVGPHGTPQDEGRETRRLHSRRDKVQPKQRSPGEQRVASTTHNML